MGALAERLNYPTEFVTPIRAYVNSNYYKGHLISPAQYLSEICNRFKGRLNESYFSLAFIWGSKHANHVDFMGFLGLAERGPDWKRDKLSLQPWSVCDGKIVRLHQGEIGIIVAGEEMKHRKTTRQLTDFALNPPHLGRLEPKRTQGLVQKIIKMEK